MWRVDQVVSRSPLLSRCYLVAAAARAESRSKLRARAGSVAVLLARPRRRRRARGGGRSLQVRLRAPLLALFSGGLDGGRSCRLFLSEGRREGDTVEEGGGGGGVEPWRRVSRPRRRLTSLRRRLPPSAVLVVVLLVDVLVVLALAALKEPCLVSPSPRGELGGSRSGDGGAGTVGFLFTRAAMVRRGSEDLIRRQDSCRHFKPRCLRRGSATIYGGLLQTYSTLWVGSAT